MEPCGADRTAPDGTISSSRWPTRIALESGDEEGRIERKHREQSIELRDAKLPIPADCGWSDDGAGPENLGGCQNGADGRRMGRGASDHGVELKAVTKHPATVYWGRLRRRLDVP
jgi:hypothetical protein